MRNCLSDFAGRDQLLYGITIDETVDNVKEIDSSKKIPKFDEVSISTKNFKFCRDVANAR